MRRRATYSLALCLLALTALPRLSWGQANINEGLETAFIYVDITNGSDTNGNGSITNPYQTITKGASVAEANNQAGIGTQVNIQPGTYRESITITAADLTTSLPITFQAVTNGTVVIDGATILTGWTPYSGNSNIYTTSWTYNFPTCPVIPGCPAAQSIVLQQEMMVVNNVVMTQVLSIAELQPGSFYVDQTHSLVYLYPPSGTNVNTATIETATEPVLFALAGASNIVLRGLTFEYANSCRSSGAVSISGNASNVLLDTLTIQWNNAQGLNITNPFTNYTVQNTISNHNGDSGFQEYQTLNGLWTNDTANFNNWRGAQGGYYACNVGGHHPFQSHVDTLNGMTYAYNQSYGIHWDTDNANDSATNLTSTNNLVGSVFSEKNEGPLSITSSNLCNGNALLGAGGLAIRNSTDVSITNSTVINNPPAQIVVFGTPGGIEITNWETGQEINLITNALTITGNVIEGEGSTQQVFQDATLNGSDWTTFIKNFDSNNNTWWNASNSTTPFEVPVPAVDTLLNFAGWQSTTGQDAASTFSAPTGNPGSACSAIVPDMPDYWLNIDNTLLTTNPVGQAIFNLTATPLDFSGTLSLLLDGIQGITGMSSSFSPATIPLTGGNPGSSVLTITALTTTPPGTYNVSVVSNSGNLTKMVTAQVTVPTLGFRLNTVLLAFPTENVNTTSPPQSVTLTNYGSTSTKITSIVSNLPVFTITANTCGSSLGAGASCTVTLTFKPNSAGNFVGSLTFTDADVTSPQVVTLTGTGENAPTATLLPATMSFGSVDIGTTSASKTSTLTDTSTTSALNITSITITGADAGDFQLAPATTCPSSGTVNPLGTCLIVVTFSPTATGSRSATLTVNDNTSTGKQTIALTGVGATGTDATATLLPASLSFGSVNVGSTSAAQSSTLTDTSTTVELAITSIALSGSNPGDFTITPASTCPTSGTIQPLATCLVTITFSPTATGSRSATLTVTDNTSAGSQTVSLTGTGTGTSLATATLLPASLGFGSIAVGSTSAAQSSTLTDTSTTVALNITSITLTGANPGDFKITSASTCPNPGTIPALGTCLVTITFSPTASGSRSATLTVNDNTSAGAQTVSLTGTGTVTNATATLLPATLGFGSVAVGSTSAAQSSTLTDTSTTVALNISSITLTGANPGDFKITSASTCPNPGTIQPLATCLVTVTFTPTATGARSATLTVSDNTSAGSQTVSLTGTGTSSSLATATLLPATLGFGSVAVGSTSAAKSSTLTDTSTTVTLNISSIALSGANPGDFKITSASTCPNPGTIQPLATCLVTVTFTPTATGARSATLTVSDNTSAGSQTVSLTGTGTTALATATLIPASLSFGSVTVGSTSAAKTSTLTDTSTTVALNISSITLTGANPGDFKITSASTCPNSGTIQPLGTCLITVTFTPTATGARSATLTVNDNTSAGKQTISLTGTGAAAVPTATLLPASLSFGSVAVSVTSAAKTSTLTDTSTTVALNISSITITGANAGDFKLTSATTCPSSGTIPALGTCIVSVTFTPSAPGARSATLTVNDNTSAGKQTVSLSGTGVVTATLLPASLNFGSVTVGSTSAAKSSTLTDTSSAAALTITGITLGGTDPGDFQITSATTCPTSGTLNPLKTCLITVTFTPTATGARSATVTVDDNTSSGKQTISLSGTGG
jgi:hypothetical protein